ncbi:gamma-glutamyltransferase [Sphingomonas sp. XMGL2]|uniref:Glutathione hydrolase proenzyme n=2 Tax=Sphingomonas quercus TaxID=2842451 RepID=A0ABS6BPD5_9SPHN|nr:gamma-glutamyltransferase [Sphingomonas quercus]
MAAAGLAAVTVMAAVLAVPSTAQPQPGPAGFDAFRGDRGYGWAGQTRSEMLARHGIVATSQPLAADAGLDILKAGGNAFDAAVATAAVLNVVEPNSAGLGADMFVIAWSAKDRKLVALDGAGRAPAGFTPDRFRGKGLTRMPNAGIDSAVVPGAVDGWDVLLKRYGTMGFKQVLEPAARIAEEGYGVTERIQHEWAGAQKLLSADPDSVRTYLPGGKAPAMYQIFRNPDLARALRLLEAGGRDVFYKGEIARAIVAKSQATGGAITMDDLAGIRARWVTPITTKFHGYDLYQMPPSTQGFAVLEMMNVLDVCAPKLGIAPDPKSAAYWHLMVEAKKLAYADLERWDGDPDFSKVPTDRLVSKAYAAELCARIDPNHASALKPASDPIGGTVYISVADRFGNVVSFIYSVYGEFGSGVTIPGYGFILNNRAANFVLDPNSPNVVAPRKRPFYTLIPGFVMKDGKPLLSFGVMSGDQQAQGQAQVLANMLLFGANPQAASDAARFSHAQRTNKLVLESQLYAAIGEKLKAMGHDVAPGNGVRMGGYQAIMIDPETGLLRGGSDHRKDGVAIGY